MEKEKYEDAARRLKRLIKAIFDDNLERIGIDDYDDAMKTECIDELFRHVYVVANGITDKQQLAEMAWYGCDLDFFGASFSWETKNAVCRLYFDCRKFINDTNV